MLELNAACKMLPQYYPDIDRQSMTDWIPDIRHAVVHRNRMTAVAACRMIWEAASFADALDDPQSGNSLRTIAEEMDWCRMEMKKNDVVSEQELSTELKTTIEDRLTGVLAAVETGAAWEWAGKWKMSEAVVRYSMAKKWSENPWSDTRYWGQDRNRNYISHGSSRTPSTFSSEESRPAQALPNEANSDNKPQRYVPPCRRSVNGSWR